MIRLRKKLSTLNHYLVYNSNSILSAISKGIQQKRCLFCDETCYNKNDICLACQHDLPWNECYCRQCSLPMPTSSRNKQTFGMICGECISTPPPFNKTVAPFRYEIPVNKAIRILKYQQKLYFAKAFTHFLADAIDQQYQKDSRPNCLIPVPMYKDKLKERGFNQAQLISKQLSQLVSIPTHESILQKIKSTPAQTGLNKTQRTQNLKGSFQLNESVSGLHIALVDDVVTTRATSDLLCKLLINAGAKRVDVWCIARTAKYRN